jgi:peptide/nickel transport system substrate-binding protein
LTTACQGKLWVKKRRAVQSIAEGARTILENPMSRFFRFAAVTTIAVMFSAVAATAAETKVLRWTSQGDALTLDPHALAEAPTIGMLGSIYERLVNRDPTMTLVPELASEWSNVQPNVWEFKLRSGVKFHKGQDLTAEDVVFSINRAKSESSNFKEQVASIVQVTALDDLTVEIVTAGPNPILLDELTSVFIMDKSWAEANGVTAPQDYAASQETFAVKNANGTGPFVLESRAPDELTVLVANPTWWGSNIMPGNIDRIEFRPIKFPATRVAALLAGEVDFVLDPPLQDIDRINATDGLKTETQAQIRTIFFGMDVASPELRTSDVKGRNPFADAKVRQAMNLAIDRNALKEIVMSGQSIPAGMVTSPGVRGYTPELDAVVQQDIDAAKTLMAEAGFSNGFSVRLDCPNDRYINDAAICEAAVGMFAKIGVKISLEAVSKALHFPKVQDRATDLYMLGWGVPTLDSHYALQYLLEKSGSWNATGYDNARVNEITALIATEIDQTKRNALIAEAWAIVAADSPYIPLHHQVLTWAMSEKLTLPIAADDIPRFSYAVLD